MSANLAEIAAEHAYETTTLVPLVQDVAYCPLCMTPGFLSDTSCLKCGVSFVEDLVSCARCSALAGAEAASCPSCGFHLI